jgi:hypothetical protein
MKVHLLHPDHDFEVIPELRDAVFDAMLSSNPFALTRARGSRQTAELDGPRRAMVRDLALEPVWQAMAAGDEFLLETAKRAMLSSLASPEEIVYRQRVLADCLAQPAVVRELYGLACDALEHERQAGPAWHGDRADTILHRSVRVLQLQLDSLRQLRAIADRHADDFQSGGFAHFFAGVREELSAAYLETIEWHLHELEFKRGVLESARLGKGLKGLDYTVHVTPERRWTERLGITGRGGRYSFTVPARDEPGFRALEELRGRGIAGIADAVARSAAHVKGYFAVLRLELAFYVACLNLHERLAAKDEPTCFPTPVDGGLSFTARDLHDVSLTLHLEAGTVGNDVDADGKSLVVITGANQGGKSTFLRSAGLALLMMQCGMFVGARCLRASVAAGVFTHYKREEDASMRSGKLDEELARMSEIADRIRPGCILLCNESFASTNEREGSEIARQVIGAMRDAGVRILLVTHMYDLGRTFYEREDRATLFLRAERRDGGRASFKLSAGAPRPTSHGVDSYRRIFGQGAPAPVS